MNNSISRIDNYLIQYAESIPAKGMHLHYLEKASELTTLYGEALSVMEDEENLENEKKIDEIEREIKNIVE